VLLNQEICDHVCRSTDLNEILPAKKQTPHNKFVTYFKNSMTNLK
jgi:hypothetical protein